MHEGHRDRVKKRFRQEGLDHFSDIQALELLLFYGIPRVDTNPIAHALLDRFGSLSSHVLLVAYKAQMLVCLDSLGKVL